MSEKSTGKQDPRTLRVRFERTEALYASQFVIHASASEVILDFSTGYVDEGQGQVLPIHSRIAMSRDGAARLLQALGRAVGEPAGTPERPRGATLPGLN